MPGLPDVAFEDKRSYCPNDGATTNSEQPSDTAQRWITTTGLAIEMVDDRGSHALFRSC